ncbi:hypothetical protein IFM89_034911 [Coptis chinensis]|uniref:Lipin N-terminal domain-containing protein n=1 Tax=Coptis chinensis TaxID=261450 RepID=A0A835I9E3_9MAGN|nr:hypothetical protein IFM89_034911 [Coptis chinensis]
MISKVGSFISQGVYSVATPFHPFGGAVDVIVVEQQDGTYRSTPWYVRFGKFQGVLKGAEKMVRISVNGVEANFHMYLDNSGEAYFIREVVVSSNEDGDKNLDSLVTTGGDGGEKNEDTSVSICRNKSDVDNAERSDGIENSELDGETRLYEFEGQPPSCEDSVESTDYRAYYERLEQADDQSSDSEVVLFSVDGHVLTAPISLEVDNVDNLQLSTPQFHLGPGEGADFDGDNEDYTSGQETWTADFGNIEASAPLNSGEDYSNAFGKVSENSTLNVDMQLTLASQKLLDLEAHFQSQFWNLSECQYPTHVINVRKANTQAKQAPESSSSSFLSQLKKERKKNDKMAKKNCALDSGLPFFGLFVWFTSPRTAELLLHKAARTVELLQAL